MLPPKSLRLADLCLPPVIQRSALDAVQQLVHIIPQHALARPEPDCCCCHEDSRATGELSCSITAPPVGRYHNGRMRRFSGGACVSLTLQVSSGCSSEAGKSDELQTDSGGSSFNYKTVKLEPSQREALHSEETVSHNSGFSSLFTCKLLQFCVVFFV